MIFFINNSGTIIHDLPEQVYQGSANANSIYVVAPFARNLTATVAFGLPNGVFTKPGNLSYTGEITGFTDEQGTSYYGWSYEIPNDITALYGTVIAQFTFYSGGRMLATSSTSFTVGRGIPPIMPETPTEDIYEQILQLISSIQQDLGNGYYTARAVYAWNSTYKYGANELVYYPTGEYGVYVKSLVANNTQPPYTNGVIGSNWRLVVDFNDIMNAQAEIAESVAKAAQSATEAASSASSASNSASSSAQSAAKALNQANAAQASAEAASGSERSAAESATEVREALGNYYTKIEIDGSVAKTLEVSIDNITYEMDFVLKSADGTVLSANTIDLPLESVVVSGRYDTATKTILLTLQNGQTVSIPIGDLIDGLASQEALDDVIDGTTPVAKAVRADTAANADNANKVTNSLTIITDGVPTEYNGGTAKEVVINTTSSTDPEAVHYTPQNLMEAQQAQARANIDAQVVGESVLLNGDQTINGKKTFANNVLIYDSDLSTYLDLGKSETTGIEFHIDDNSIDYDTTIQCVSGSNPSKTPGGGKLVYTANGGHEFAGAITAKNYNDLISAGNEFNFVPSGFSDSIHINYRTSSGGQDGNINKYIFRNGGGGYAGITAGDIYDNDQRVYSPNNPPPIFTHNIKIDTTSSTVHICVTLRLTTKTNTEITSIADLINVLTEKGFTSLDTPLQASGGDSTAANEGFANIIGVYAGMAGSNKALYLMNRLGAATNLSNAYSYTVNDKVE